VLARTLAPDRGEMLGVAPLADPVAVLGGALERDKKSQVGGSAQPQPDVRQAAS